MTIQEAIKSGKPFKRYNWDKWLTEINKDIIISLSREDLMATDWIIQSELFKIKKFKEKYPNGVLCWCWHIDKSNKKLDIILEIKDNVPYPFKGLYDVYSNAEPVKPEEAPAIIGGNNE